jgi:hypothetical protein
MLASLLTGTARREVDGDVRESRLGHALPVRGLERAKADLARGDVHKARDRLKGLLGTYPTCHEVRRLLAEAYRRDRQPSEAGRWGYLVGSHAGDLERAAFERHCWRGRSRIAESDLRRLLRTVDLALIADEAGRELLAALPHARPSGRKDGPVEALSRLFASLRARRSWAGSRSGRRPGSGTLGS